MLFALAFSVQVFAADDKPLPLGPQQDGPFRKVILAENPELKPDGLIYPMELAVAQDGRVFYIERAGALRIIKTDGTMVEAGRLAVFDGLEDGLLGLTLDPDFARNNWIYLNRSLPETYQDENGQKAGKIRSARFTMKGDTLDLASEKVLVEVQTQRETCCHVGGSMAFDSKGNLYVAVGDNTNPFHDESQTKDRNGYAPIDERPMRGPYDAQKSSANMNDLRGGVYRIHPKPDGTYTIPKGNLFPPGTPGTRPEVYTKGTRNSFRISIDPMRNHLYWGDVGPDAGSFSEKYGPAGFDEINQAKGPGFFGWPLFMADNKAYVDWDYETQSSRGAFDPKKAVNDSPNNTGIRELPAPQAALIYYPHAPSTRFPVVNGPGGRTAMAGPVYHFDENLKSPHKLPKKYDNHLFIYEWSRNWIIAVKLDQDGNLVRKGMTPEMERFCANMTFKRPMDLELGPDGCLYLAETGTAWSNNRDTQISRIEYHGE
ncbi:MAG TPA: glycosyl hydrolase [Verrucomicrobiales bacterium]|nr:glycosyl hydrolase [Verrucomicrobiales bacterium]